MSDEIRGIIEWRKRRLAYPSGRREFLGWDRRHIRLSLGKVSRRKRRKKRHPLEQTPFRSKKWLKR